MQKRTRFFFLIMAGVLAGGLGTGLVASYMGLQPLALLKDGPSDLSYVPADAQMVGYVNVRQVMDSEFRQKFRELRPSGTPEASFESLTGINIDSDIDEIVVAAFESQENGPPLVAARGRFDEVRIESAIRERGGAVQDYAGKRLLTISGENPVVVVFPEPGLALIGPASSVRKALDTHGGNANVTGNAELMALVRDVESETAWTVGRFAAFANNGRIPSAVVEQLPPINLFAASGHLNGGLRATVRAEARDDASAQNLRDVIKGFVALARLQAGQQQQLLGLLDSVQLAGEGRTVALSVTIPAEALNLLAPSMPRREARSPF